MRHLAMAAGLTAHLLGPLPRTPPEPIPEPPATGPRRELGAFLAAYRGARSVPALTALVAPDAVLWTCGRMVRGRDAVIARLLAGGEHTPANVEWLISPAGGEALCSAETPGGHLSMLVQSVAGHWRIVYLHIA
ncbi:hypothetical protein AB0F81_34645 [Actinoplanes sp. NPDC024001]|uniref:hypothetical protein n=1 Tax=Actinoplanes sp. NPDC024001 TaxID=3154598 RepID=UPI0033F211BC